MMSICLSIWLLVTMVLGQTSYKTVPCTMHAYEGMLKQYGNAIDNSPPWCGQRYTILNVARVVAITNMSPGMCNQCIEIVGVGRFGGPKVYALAVDQRQAYGLDIAESSYKALFPRDNILNPHTCKYRVVNPSFCGKICYGTKMECTRGKRNLLPAYLLPKYPRAPVGLKATRMATNSSVGSAPETIIGSAPSSE
jgi:hypothetical protein